MWRLAQKLGVIMLMVVTLSVGFDAVYRLAYHAKYQWPQNVWILPSIKDKYEIVKLGNSHAQEGLTFARYRLKSLDLAGVSQSFEYDLANLKMHVNQIKEGAVIIIDISPISFSQGRPGREDSFQTVYYDGKLSPFLIPHLKVEDYLQSQFFPFLRSGFLWRQKISDEITKRISAEEKWPEPSPTPKIAVEAGAGEGIEIRRVSFFNANDIENELTHHTQDIPKRLDGSMNFIFDKWYRSGGFGTQYFDANRKDLENLIAYALEKKWRPVLITIPISKVLQAGLLPDYMQVYVYKNVSKANLRGVQYFDFTKNDQLTGDSYLYRDSDHLNPNGAAVLSYLLLQKLINQGYLPKSADGYDHE